MAKVADEAEGVSGQAEHGRPYWQGCQEGFSPPLVDWHTVGLDQSYSDGPRSGVVVLLQLCLPQDGIPVLAEVLLAPWPPGNSPEPSFWLNTAAPIQAIVADMVAGGVGQAGSHHPLHHSPY